MSQVRWGSNSVKPASTSNWGDVDNEEDEEPSVLSSPTSAALSGGAVNPILSSATDSRGIKTVVEFGTNAQGEKIKITRKIKVRHKENKEEGIKRKRVFFAYSFCVLCFSLSQVLNKPVKVNRHVLERQNWAKFGDCAGVPRGPEQNVTYQSFEIIHLDLRPKKREEEKEESSLDKLSGTSSIVVCRNCGETGHWTLKCPKRQTIQAFAKDSPLAEAESAAVSGGGAGGRYVPMHMRAGASERPAALSNLRDEYTLRVTNLSDEVTEADLQDLFRRFGHTTRIYLARDRQTNESRGFAFVNYGMRADAERAIEKLNGHGYANLILHVEWAKPREEREKPE
jgi:translation initiation factor 3 subunit G